LISTALKRSSTLGWIIKFNEDRDVEIRVLSWNLLSVILDSKTLEIYSSVVDSSLNVIF
jgi:hypothetical protein